MKTFTKTLVAGAIMTASMLSASAQAEQKIGVINEQAIFQAIPQAATMQQALTAEFKDEVDALEKLRNDIVYEEQKATREAATMSAAQKEELSKKIAELKQDYASKAQPLQQRIQRRQQEEQNRLRGLIQQAINTIAAKDKYDIILGAQAVAYASEEANISEAVIKQVSEVK